MKKFMKFLCGAASVVAVAFGAYCVYKNVIAKKDDEDFDDEDCDGECDDCELCGSCEFCDDDNYFEIVCPSCGETVCFDESVNSENLTCPACGAEIGAITDDDE